MAKKEAAAAAAPAKNPALESALAQIQKQFGKEAIMTQTTTAPTTTKSFYQIAAPSGPLPLTKSDME